MIWTIRGGFDFLKARVGSWGGHGDGHWSRHGMDRMDGMCDGLLRSVSFIHRYFAVRSQMKDSKMSIGGRPAACAVDLGSFPVIQRRFFPLHKHISVVEIIIH